MVSKSNQRNKNYQRDNFDKHKRSFRSLSLYPENEDIYSEQPDLCPIKIKGPYRSVENYLDVQFKVLREDFISPLRQAITMYKQQCKTQNGSLKINGIEIYKTVKFISHSKICFDVKNEIKGVDWESAKRFMTGSLLMFTNNNFDSFFLATVANTEVSELKKKLISVELVDKEQYRNYVINKYFTMVESESFFTPYYHVLKSLQDLNETNFPFKKYFVDVNFKLQPPKYLKNHDVYDVDNGFGRITFKILDDSKWPTPMQLRLDVSQYNAFKAALTKELVVIQGPPGTGKTFIGLKIVEALLMNSRIWNKNSTPILLVCFTNHALDQFLEGLLPFTKKLVRIGKNDGGKLKEFNLREKRKQCANRRQFDISSDLQILRSAFVVGTTTTLAAKNRQLFELLGPIIVIVEEAAEVLEAHIIASLTGNCQHIILIGDHKQLRPNVNEVRSAKKYKLDVSLFERLIGNGMPYHMLISQHRMRPEISELLIRTIYPLLQNHSSVLGRESIKGIDKNIFFMTHSYEELQDGGTSKTNYFETVIVLNLAKYLVKQGYQPEEITILATYKGQTNYIVEMGKSCGLPLGLKITTVDNFQGEENRIILLSLVRSNLQNEIGFLKTENRICVALSRARDGFYIVGNLQCLISGSRSHTKSWAIIKGCLFEQQSYGASLPLRCQVHKDQITRVTSPKDFDLVSHGGCTLPCGQKLSCGHKCKSKCHGPTAQRNIHRCQEMCARILCSKGHRCHKKCSDPCEKCLCRSEMLPPVYTRPIIQPAPRIVTPTPRIVTDNTNRVTDKSRKWWSSCTLL